MNSAAIIMMIVAMVTIWGGLGLAIFNLTRHDAGRAEEVRRDL